MAETQASLGSMEQATMRHRSSYERARHAHGGVSDGKSGHSINSPTDVGHRNAVVETSQFGRCSAHRRTGSAVSAAAMQEQQHSDSPAASHERCPLGACSASSATDCTDCSLLRSKDLQGTRHNPSE